MTTLVTEDGLITDVDKVPALEHRLMTPLLSKKVPAIPKEEERLPYQLFHTNFLARVFFWWLNPILKVGYKRTLTPNDMYYVEGDMTAEKNFEDFVKNLDIILNKSRAKAKLKNPDLTEEELQSLPYPKYSLVQALFMTFKYKYSKAVFFKACADVAQVLTPLLTKALINFVEKKTYLPETPIGKGVGYAIGTAAMLLLNGMLINHFLHNSITVGAQCKSILTTALLKKSFKVTPKTKHLYSNGKVTSILATDLSRIDLAIGFQPFAITFIIPVIISIALLIVNIGVSALVGIAIFVIAIAVIGGGAKRLLMMRRNANQYTDGRVSLMREILNSMKIIKFYAWEDAYENNVVDQRTKETKIILKMQAIRNFLLAFSISLPSIISMVSFLVLYGIKGRTTPPGEIFASLSLFGNLSQQVMMLPMALATGADAMIGIGRVREYLQTPDLEDEEGVPDNYNNENLPSDVAVRVDDASFEWEQFNDEEDEDDSDSSELSGSSNKSLSKVPTSTSATDEEKLQSNNDNDNDNNNNNSFQGFHNINFEIKKNEFVIITGPIGSGKSSLLTALAGFMNQTGGQLAINGSLLLCGQPWVQNATFKENVLFGSPYDEARYNKVIEVCALTDDIKLLPGGHDSEIGERGINLSGGQKARINLARAVYADKDIVLFDDVLSAVDARVGKHITDRCFVDFMEHKTRVLATHQLSLIDNADRVIFLNGDGSINIGTVSELLASNEEFLKLMEHSKKQMTEEENARKANEPDEKEQKDSNNNNNSNSNKDLELQKLKTALTSGSNFASGDDEEDKDYTKESGVLIEDEERARNAIGWSVYKEYLKQGQGIFGILAVPLAMILLVLDIFTSLFANVWLSFWISNKFPGRSNGFYIGIYVMFTCLSVVIIILEFVILGYISITSSRKLNLNAAVKVLHAPMSFIDTTPLGRILNRFSKDTDVLDNEIGEQMRMFLHPAAFVVGVIILNIIYLPWFALTVPPLVICFVGITNFYQASSREVKRLEAVQRSFVYNNFNEVLGGMQTIKAYKSNDRFLLKNDKLINKMNEAYFITIANQRWISLHLDVVACSLAFVIAMLSVTRQFSINAASVGLVVTYSLQLAGLMSLILRAYTQIENEMNSVERMVHYSNHLTQEASYRIQESKPDPSWPAQGAIKFNSVSLRYRDGLPLVLKNLSLDIKGGEKIGICGRTGAGKSSIMVALYRINELAHGSVEIDGLDVSQIGLFDLRSKLSIIPQDPVLFQGTIRKNLDPFNEHPDSVLWDALRRSGLIESSQMDQVASTHMTNDSNEKATSFHKFHLDQTVEDEGANFSLGERQLIALARALVRNSKILILDEATSSVDYETDSKIQNTIKKEFGNCTILCIAHRLKTILEYDRILVLEKGEIEEFDTPLNLFNNEHGIFRQMCEKSDIKQADF